MRNELTVLNIPFSFGGVEDVIHPAVLRDGRYTVLVDCGYPGYLPQLERALAEHGITCGEITHVVVTHQDHDHVGALAALKRANPRVQVVAGRREAPYLCGRAKPLRLAQAEAMQPNLPASQQAFGLAFCDLLRRVEPVDVDCEVQEGDRLDWCDGCIVLETPGHTPGHISLYLPGLATMIAGDVAVVENGNLAVTNPQYALNLAQAEASLKRLTCYGATAILCYHGGVWQPPV